MIIATVVAAVVGVGIGMRAESSGAPVPAPGRQATTGPSTGWARLVSLSTDLGPARMSAIDVLVTLRSGQAPLELEHWARARGLRVTWYTGESYAVLSGSTSDMGAAFGVSIDRYRSRTGDDFYSSDRQPSVPVALRDQVDGIGMISDYGHPIEQILTRAYVPNGGLTPAGLLQAYQATPLSDLGLQGQGQTVVILEASPFKQSDLDLFTQKFGLPPLNVQIVGQNTSAASSDTGEADMDIETVHEIAPQAKIVYYDILAAPGATNSSDFGALIALSLSAVSRQFPGAVISASLGLCELGENKADVQAINSAAAAVEATGSTFYDSSGDAGGADCGQFGADSLSSAKGVQMPADVPNVTGVGGTSLSVTTNGDYVGETTWSSSMMSQGSAGGVSVLASRPSWQTGPGVGTGGVGPGREVPDVAADADPVTGNAFVTGGQLSTGGGTSLAAPIWAGMTTLMDQFLKSKGAPELGFANPTFYKLAAETQLSPTAFHDVTVGGNVFYQAGPGYSPVTGLGSPDVAALAQYVLDLDKGVSP